MASSSAWKKHYPGPIIATCFNISLVFNNITHTIWITNKLPQKILENNLHHQYGYALQIISRRSSGRINIALRSKKVIIEMILEPTQAERNNRGYNPILLRGLRPVANNSRDIFSIILSHRECNQIFIYLRVTCNLDCFMSKSAG